eukprot:c33770_g1_i1.p1 GENE.c33770_g1_i1~~c33770_g1_i1.p1  ORF type:complete len:125 (+),score=36.81 c33770_g1_i1:22-396(+)
MAGRLGSKIGAEGGLVGIIGDDDTVSGFLLAGIGNIDRKRQKNFLVVDAKTSTSQIEETFLRIVNDPQTAILLITQTAADRIRHLLVQETKAIPAILEIPSKDTPYDPAKDYIMQRIRKLYGAE